MFLFGGCAALEAKPQATAGRDANQGIQLTEPIIGAIAQRVSEEIAPQIAANRDAISTITQTEGITGWQVALTFLGYFAISKGFNALAARRRRNGNQ